MIMYLPMGVRLGPYSTDLDRVPSRPIRYENQLF